MKKQGDRHQAIVERMDSQMNELKVQLKDSKMKAITFQQEIKKLKDQLKKNEMRNSSDSKPTGRRNKLATTSLDQDRKGNRLKTNSPDSSKNSFGSLIREQKFGQNKKNKMRILSRNSPENSETVSLQPMSTQQQLNLNLSQTLNSGGIEKPSSLELTLQATAGGLGEFESIEEAQESSHRQRR